jgi:hypothetical protein
MQQTGVSVQQAMQQSCNTDTQSPYFSVESGALHATDRATGVQNCCCMGVQFSGADATTMQRPESSHTDQTADLREHFEERAAILEHDGCLPRSQAEAEAAKMTATLARNRGYSWAALREAFRDYPAILAQLPDRTGPINSLPLGTAKLAIHPRHGVMPQGRHVTKGAA